MAHTPLGYKIVNGKAKIDDENATKVLKLFKLYLSGLSLTDCSKYSKINLVHSTISRMLSNKKYLGDDFYPQIIDKDIFKKVQILKNQKTIKLKSKIMNKQVEKSKINKNFKINEIKQNYTDPFKQAEYIYSLIN